MILPIGVLPEATNRIGYSAVLQVLVVWPDEAVISDTPIPISHVYTTRCGI